MTALFIVSRNCGNRICLLNFCCYTMKMKPNQLVDSIGRSTMPLVVLPSRKMQSSYNNMYIIGKYRVWRSTYFLCIIGLLHGPGEPSKEVLFYLVKKACNATTQYMQWKCNQWPNDCKSSCSCQLGMNPLCIGAWLKKWKLVSRHRLYIQSLYDRVPVWKPEQGLHSH